MTTPTVPVIDIQRYVAAVRRSLSDLPPEDVDDLTQGMEADLAELAEESPTDLATRLGTPEEYAAELRSAAGLPAFRPHDRGLAQVQSWVQTWVGNVRSRYPRLTGLATELAPVWWFVRGTSVGLLVGALTGDPPVAVILSVVGLFGSVWLGLSLRTKPRGPIWRGPVSFLISVVGAVMIPVWLLLASYAVASTSQRGSYDQESSYTPGLSLNENPVSQVYAYDSEGHRLDNVRLFTEQGEPLNLNEIMTGQPPATWLDAGGRSWQNVYPTHGSAGQGWQVQPNSGWWTPPLSIDALTQQIGTADDQGDLDPYSTNPNAPTQAATTPSSSSMSPGSTPSGQTSSSGSTSSGSTEPSRTASTTSSSPSTRHSSSGSSSRPRP